MDRAAHQQQGQTIRAAQLLRSCERDLAESRRLERSLKSLITLLSIYVLGLLLIYETAEGPDVGIFLVAIISHACFVLIRTICRWRWV